MLCTLASTPLSIEFVLFTLRKRQSKVYVKNVKFPVLYVKHANTRLSEFLLNR